MSVTAVVQARAGSTRLPGKVLADVHGTPLLGLVLGRVMLAPVDDVVLATTTHERDDTVASLGTHLGVPVVRGSEHDVLQRFVAALDAYPCEHVVRLTGDCPLLDPAVIADALAVHRVAGADYTSNTLVRTFPDGLDVEVVRPSCLRAADAEATDETEREHVTPFLYRRPDRFALASFRAPEFLGDERWTIDTAEDLEWLRGVVTKLGTRTGWRDVLERAGRQVDPDADVLRLVPAAASTPARRVWDLTRRAVHFGTVALDVHDGIGHATMDVPAELAVPAEALLRDRLRADAQIKELMLTARQPDPS